MRALALVWDRTRAPSADSHRYGGSRPERRGPGWIALLLALNSIGASVGVALAVSHGPSAYPPSTPQASYHSLPGAAHHLDVGAGWFNATDGPQPSGRYAAAEAYDPDLRAVLLVDGASRSSGYGSLNDSWEYAGGVWSKFVTANGTRPPAVGGASLTYDPVDGYMMMVGGAGTSGYEQNVWALRGDSWASLTQLPSPFQNQEAAAVYDSSDGYVLVVGCYGAAFSGLAYSWTGGSWTDRGGMGSPGDCWGTLIDDPSLGGVLLFGGQTVRGSPSSATWLYSAGNWTNLTSQVGTLPGSGDPTAREFGVGCYDAQARQALLLLGVSPTAPLTYALEGSWTNLSSGTQPSKVYSPGFAYDASYGECLLEDGLNSATWSWSAHPSIANLTELGAPNPADVNVSVSFNATWIGGIPPFQFTWEFGDGSASSALGLHSYAAVGSYVVNLTLRDVANHTQSSTYTVEVVSYPVTPPYSVPDPTEVGVSTQFEPGSTGGTYPTVGDWSFGDGTTSRAPAPLHAYSSAGNFTVTVSLSDNRGRTLIETFVDVVRPRLAVTILADVVHPAPNQSITFTADVYGGIAPFQYRWSFGDGSGGTGATSATHAYTSTGPFTPTVNVSDALGATAAASRSVVLALNLTVSANWSLGGLGLNVGFRSAVLGGVPPYAYVWEFGDGGTDRSADPSHTYESAGNFTARLTVTDANGSLAAATWPVTVAGGVGPLRASIVAYPWVVPPEGSTVLSAWAEGGSGGYRIAWATPGLNCVSSGLLTQTCSADGPGTYEVSVIVTDERGSSVNDTASLVFEAPTLPVGPTIPAPPPSLSPTLPDWEIGAFVVATLLFGAFLILSILSAIGAVTGRRPPRGGPPLRPTEGIEFPELPDE